MVKGIAQLQTEGFFMKLKPRSSSGSTQTSSYTYLNVFGMFSPSCNNRKASSLCAGVGREVLVTSYNNTSKSTSSTKAALRVELVFGTSPGGPDAQVKKTTGTHSGVTALTELSPHAVISLDQGCSNYGLRADKL